MCPRPIARCNGCGTERATSAEHLLHRAVGQVILGSRSPDTETLRRRLRDGYVKFDAGDGQAVTPERDDVRLDAQVLNLLCKDCNEGWADDLELAAGNNLYDFLHLRGRLDQTTVTSWAHFFAVKATWYYEKTDALKSAPYAGILGALSGRSDAALPLELNLARLQASGRRWDFGYWSDHTAGTSRYFWFLHGLVFFLTTRGTSLPVGAVEATDDLTLSQVPWIRNRDLVKIVPPEAVLYLKEIDAERAGSEHLINPASRNRYRKKRS